MLKSETRLHFIEEIGSSRGASEVLGRERDAYLALDVGRESDFGVALDAGVAHILFEISEMSFAHFKSVFIYRIAINATQ